MIAACKSARVIAADGGILHAAALDVVPELWVGDFDSAPSSVMEPYKHVEKLTFERQKDVTDGTLAIEYAVNEGARQIELYGAFGGERTDHMLALMMEMSRLSESGLQISMNSGFEKAWPLHAKEGYGANWTFDLPKGSLFSILPLSDLVGLSIKGARYPLDNARIDFGRTTTLSNVVSDGPEISLQQGRAVMIARPFDHSGV